MLLNKEFKNKNEPEAVASAAEYLRELKFIHKPMIALSEHNKDALLTVFIGTDDKHNLADIATRIQAKCLEYMKVMPEASSGGNKVVSNETAEKNRIASELIALNKELEKRLSKVPYSIHTSKFNAMAAFYPSSEFLVYRPDQNRAEITHPKSFEHSSVLSTSGNKNGYPNIAVTAPTSGAVYSYLADIFGNSSLLAHCLRASALSTWSKYTNGRSVPVSVSWGLFLLALGIHPFYKLEHRHNTKKLMEDPLFKDIFPFWNETFNHELWDKFKKYDLEPFSRSRNKKEAELDLPALREEFYEVVKQWYAEGNSHPEYSTVEALFDDVKENLNDETRTDTSWKKVSGIILDLSNLKVFRQNKTRLYVIAFSQPHTFSEDLADNIFDLSSIATFLHLEANPSPNIYTMLRHLADPETGNSQAITKLTGISAETWVRYDQGTRIPHSSAWTSIVISLDIHPIYKVVKRTNKDEIEKVYKVFKELHLGVTSNRDNEFFMPDDVTFEQFFEKFKK